MDGLALEMKHITKNFGGVHALSDVSIELKKGEVLCLVGENGAGKSTLMKILSGVVKPTAGEIILNGQPVQIENPTQAYQLGISIVHQELVQIPYMSIAENIYIGRYPKKWGIIAYDQLRKNTQALMDRLDVHFDPDSKIFQYSVARRQLIEILKALSYDSSVIIFDEPTAALTTDECHILYRLVRKLKEQGVSIIFISHRMEDIFEIGDRIHVLRDGKTSGGGLVKDLTEKEIISMMVGRTLDQQFGEKTNTPGDVVMEIKNLTNERLKGVSFTLRKGEVLGLGGLVGAGRTEILRAIFGIDPYEGEILVNGKSIRCKDPTDAISKGFSMVPEDRKDYGVILGTSIKKNIELGILGRLSKMGIMDQEKENSISQKFMDQLAIRAPGINTNVSALSGGNQQKVVVAKCLASDPQILLLDEPTRGVDVGAKAEIYKIIDDLACAGVAILMVSSELPELIAISDRIAVMHEGELTGIVDRGLATEETIMKLAI